LSPNWAVKRPDNLSLKEAMNYDTGGLTAALCVQKLEKMGARPEDGPIAVTGSTGGVGSISIALLNQLGYRVVAFSGKPEQTEHLRSIGADEVWHRDVLNEAAELPMGSDKQHIWQRVVSDIKLANLQELCEEISIEQASEYLQGFIQSEVVGRYLVNPKKLANFKV
jgi:NADPH:quinone reductase-like Zn-dependent oxidoreductase